MTEQERINFLIDTLEGGSSIKFAKRTGIIESSISRMRSGVLGLGKRIEPILEAYPVINREWLSTGIGHPGDLSMDLMKERLYKEIAQRDDTIRVLTRQLELDQEVIENLLKK